MKKVCQGHPNLSFNSPTSEFLVHVSGFLGHSYKLKTLSRSCREALSKSDYADQMCLDQFLSKVLPEQTKKHPIIEGLILSREDLATDKFKKLYLFLKARCVHFSLLDEGAPLLMERVSNLCHMLIPKEKEESRLRFFRALQGGEELIDSTPEIALEQRRAQLNSFIQAIPEDQAIRYIDAQESDLHFIPEEIVELGNVEELIMNNNHIDLLPAFLPLQNLQTIDLSHNRLEYLPQIHLPQLDTLNLSDNRISSIAPELQLPELKWLYLANNQLNHHSFSLAPKLEKLDLRGNQLTQFPSDLAGSIQQLDLRSNQIENLPEEMRFPHLELLVLSDNQLQALPEGMHMPQIIKIDFSENKISQLPAPFHSSSLRELNLSFNCLQAFPRDLQCEDLRYLDLSDNQIREVIITHSYPFLETLSIENNQITSLPENLPLPSENLNISNNQIQRLPDCFNSMQVENFLSDDNPICELSEDFQPQVTGTLTLEGTLITELPHNFNEDLYGELYLPA